MANIKVNGKRVRELRENTSIGSKKKASLDDIAYLSESSGALRDHKELKEGEAFPFPILQFTKPWLGFVETKPDQLFDADRVKSLAYILGASFEEITNTEYANPYKGLKSFGIEDAGYFGGRSAETQQVYDRLLDHHLVGVIGASGSGKSSLVFAGVCPLIQKSQPDWEILSFRVGDKPLENLFHAVDNWLFANERMDKPKRIRAFLDNLKENHDALHFYLTSHSQNNSQTPFLLVDQFEELYTLCKDESEQEVFLKSLVHAVEQKSLRLLLTVRADFYDRLQTSPHPFFNILKPGLVDLKPMNDDDLREAIQKPAKQVNLAFEERLIDRILDGLGVNKGKLPILQFTLSKLWEVRDLDGNKIGFSHYEALGGIKGVIENHANEVVANELSDQDRLLAKLTLPTLVHLGEYGNDIKIREPLSRYSDEQIKVLRKLSNEACRLLTIEGVASPDNPDTFVEYVELAHEELIRSWPELGEWLQEDLVHHQLRSRLHSNYNEFEANQKNPDLLLPEGKPLEDAKQLVKDYGDNFLSKDIQEYITTSDKKWQVDKHRKSRLKQQNIFALIAATIFVGIAGVAGWFWNEASSANSKLSESNTILVNTNKSLDEANMENILQKDIAERSNYEAVIAKGNAEKAKKLADLTKIRFSAFEAQRLSEQGDYGSALALTLANLPSGQGAKMDHFAYAALLRGLFENSEIKLSEWHQGTIASRTFSAGNSFIITGATDNSAHIWKADGTPVKILKGHQGSITSATISADGSFIVTGSDDNTARIWRADGTLLTILKGHEGHITSVAISADGSFIVTGATDNTARIWKADGTPVTTLEGHKGIIYSVAISADNSFIVTGSHDSTARIWKADGTPVKTLEGHVSKIYSVAISADNTFIVTGSADKTARIWKADGTPVKILTGHKGAILLTIVSTDNAFIVTGATDNSARIWKADGTPVKTLEGHEEFVTSVAISADNSLIVTGSLDNSARIWRADGTLVKPLIGHEKPIHSVDISADNSFVVTVTEDNVVRIWKADGTPVKILEGHQGSITSVAISADNSFIVTGGFDNAARIWKADGTLHSILEGHEEFITSVAISADSSFIVTGSGDSTARIWKADGTLITTLVGHKEFINSVVISADSSFIVTGSSDNTARIWNTDGTLIKTLEGHQGDVSSVIISADNSLVLTEVTDKTPFRSGAWNKTVHIWKTNGIPVGTLKGYQSDITSVSISDDSSFIVTGEWDGIVRIWNVDGTLVKIIEGHEKAVASVAISADNSFIVTGGFDNAARIWKADGTLITTLVGHKDTINSVVISADSSFIVTGSGDNTARIWKADGTLVTILEGHEDLITSVSISADGSFIVTGSVDNTVRIWEIPEWVRFAKEEVITYARRVAPRGLSDRQKKLYNLLGE